MEDFLNKQSNEKENKLNELRSELERAIDGLGKKIDTGILDTTLYLNALEVRTNASCEGHLDHGLPYCWVDLATSSQSSDLYKQYIKEQRDFDETPDSHDEGKMRLFYEARYYKYEELLQKVKNEKEEIRQKVQNILDTFFEENNNFMPYRLSKGLRLLPSEVPEFNLSKWIDTLSLLEKEELLKKSQETIKRFTEYLKEIYFK